MKLRPVLFFIALLLLAIPTKAEKMTPEILLKLNRISQYSISPDGKNILYTLTTPDIDENTSTSDIYMAPIKGGTPKRLTYNGNNNSNPVWSPKGDKIAFISDRDDSQQAYILDLNGGEAVQSTFMEEGISFLSWSPDGKHLAFVSDVKLDQDISEKFPKLTKLNVRIYDDLPVRHWDEWHDEKYRHLFVIPAEGGKPKDLMKGEKYDTPLKPFGSSEDIAWSPKGTEIAYVCKKVDDYELSTNSEIYVAPVYGGKSKNITRGMVGYDTHPVYSPNGKYIAFHSMERPGYESDRDRLMLYVKSNGRIREVSSNFENSVKHTIWAPNSKLLYFVSLNNDGTNQIFSTPPTKDSPTLLTEGMYNFGDKGIAITPDGKTLLLNRRNFNNPTELFTMPAKGGSVKQITQVNNDIMKNIDRAKIESRNITSIDQKEVFCWVIYPPDFDPNKKYPMITYCQGGPQQEVSQYWSYGWNFLTMASKGYIVLAPNRRGCPGFGQKWVDEINKDYGGLAMDDIIAATRDLAQEPYVDQTRLAAVGGSAGGYAVFWLAGHNDGLFKAFISHCGLFDLVSEYGATDELWFPNWDNGGPYWEPKNARYYKENSPHSYVKDWDTPILIITGEKDYRVPYTQSLEAFTAAQANGVPSRLVYFPNENHWILHPQEKLLWYEEFFRWLKLHLK